MAFTPSLYTSFLVVATVCVLLPQAHAFGAGDIPDFAYLNDKAFRHGDIESVLENLAKTAGRAAIGGSSLIGFASSVIQAAAGPSKFSKSDIKKVYFGNWLRDYSQAMDIAGLSKLSADTLVLVVSVLGFMTFGYATEEFKVTAERLGVYLPVEHIDNPKGYAEKEGDARNYHAKLRPPVDPVELEIDPKTGMKNYMASDGRGWDTSTAFIRRTFRDCIEKGRRASGQEGATLWEAYRLLGTGLHTMEDLLAHSNWCEISLRKMGHQEVFCHVGDRVLINTPDGRAPPLVTGTFGGADFLHSLLGEAGDKLSQASVTDLSGKLDQASQGQNQADIGKLKAILDQIMGSGGSEEKDKLSQGEQMHAAAQGYRFNPDNVAPPEVQKQLLDLLKWHDDIMRNVSSKIAMVPGLSNLLEEFSNALNTYIYTVLAPYVTPILTQATEALSEGSKAVIDTDDQYEVFDNPNASDPSHSLLSKDHFGLILNEPAGKIAQIVVEYTVNLIVQAWSDNVNADQVIDKILQAYHHPYYNTGNSEIQNKMFDHMKMWLGGLSSDEKRQTIAALTKESVRNHKNKRLGSEDQNYDEPGYAPCSHAGGKSNRPTGSIVSGVSKPSQSSQYGAGAASQSASGGYGRQQQGTYGGGRQEQPSSGYGGGRQEQPSSGYGGGRQEQPSSGYGGGRQEQPSSGYGGGRQEPTSTYGSSGRQEASYGYGEAASYAAGRQDNTPSYGGGRQDNTPSYGGRQDKTASYGGGRQDNTAGYGAGRQDNSGGRREDSYGRQETSQYGNRDETPSRFGPGSQQGSGYGGSKRDEDDKPSYGEGGYGGGRRKDDDDNKPTYIGGHGGGRRKDDDDDKRAYGGGGYGDQRRFDDDKPSYGSRREGIEEDKPSYGGGGYGAGQTRRKDADDDKRGGYGHHRSDSDDKPKKYGKEDSDDEKKKKKFGKKSKDDDFDDDSRKKVSGGSGQQQGYQPSYAQAQGQGYTPSHGGGNLETFGVEKMRISRDRDSDDDDRKRRGGGGRRY